MLDFEDIDWNTTSVTSAGPLWVLQMLERGSKIGDIMVSTYEASGIIVLLKINGFIQLINLIRFPPCFGIFQLLECIVDNESSGSQKPPAYC